MLKKFKKQKCRKKFKLLMTEVSVLRSCVNNGGSVVWKFSPQLNFRHAFSTYGPRRTFSLFPEKCIIIHCVLFLEKNVSHCLAITQEQLNALGERAFVWHGCCFTTITLMTSLCLIKSSRQKTKTSSKATEFTARVRGAECLARSV